MKIKPVDLSRARSNGRATQERGSLLERRVAVLESQVYELTKGIAEFVEEINTSLDFVLDQQAEANLRVLYIMQFQKFKQHTPNAIVIPGQPAMTDVTRTLYDIYMADRDKFKAKIEEQVNAEKQAAAAALGLAPAESGRAEGSEEPARPALAPGPGDSVKH